MTELNNNESWWWLVMSNIDELTMVVIVTISLVMLTILWFISRSKRLPPGPISLPIVGYLPFLSRDFRKQVTTMGQTYGPIFKFYMGSMLFVIINSPEVAKVVVRDQDEEFSYRRPNIATFIMSHEGQDMGWSNHLSWRAKRKLFIQEVLSNKNLQACSCFRRDEVRNTIKNIFNKIGTAVNISEIAFLTETNVITSMVLDSSSSDKDSHNLNALELKRLTNKVMELLGKPNMSDFFPSLAWLDLQGIERDMKKQINAMDQIFETIIDERMKSISKNHHVSEGSKKDFLQILLELKDQNYATWLNTTVIKALLVDIILGGTETTTTVLEWAMAEIMKNPKIMNRIQEELKEVVGVNNIVEESHLPRLKYLDATVKETLRLYPPGPLLVPRSPDKDCTVSGYTVPKGCCVLINVWSIHRDPRYWDNPLEFNPDRFLENKLGDYTGNNLKYFPFGSGRRLCPGIPLADKMQMYILASLLHSFDWSLPEGETHDLSVKIDISVRKKIPLVAIPSQRLPNKSLYM